MYRTIKTNVTTAVNALKISISGKYLVQVRNVPIDCIASIALDNSFNDALPIKTGTVIDAREKGFSAIFLTSTATASLDQIILIISDSLTVSDIAPVLPIPSSGELRIDNLNIASWYKILEIKNPKGTELNFMAFSNNYFTLNVRFNFLQYRFGWEWGEKLYEITLNSNRSLAASIPLPVCNAVIIWAGAVDLSATAPSDYITLAYSVR